MTHTPGNRQSWHQANANLILAYLSSKQHLNDTPVIKLLSKRHNPLASKSRGVVRSIVEYKVGIVVIQFTVTVKLYMILKIQNTIWRWQFTANLISCVLVIFHPPTKHSPENIVIYIFNYRDVFKSIRDTKPFSHLIFCMNTILTHFIHSHVFFANALTCFEYRTHNAYSDSGVHVYVLCYCSHMRSMKGEILMYETYPHCLDFHLYINHTPQRFLPPPPPPHLNTHVQ